MTSLVIQVLQSFLDSPDPSCLVSNPAMEYGLVKLRFTGSISILFYSTSLSTLLRSEASDCMPC